MQRGVSASKEDVHNAIKNIDKGIFPQAFCKIIPDILGGDPEYCNIMHADGAGTKSSLAYLYWKETGDLSVWKGIAQDALIMNIDDLLCVGAVDNILVSSTIGRNKLLVPGEVISAIINGTDELLAELRDMGVGVYATGGETADVGDLVRTIIVDSTVTCRMKRADALLPGPDDADLVLRGHPGIHADPGYELPQFLIAHGLNNGTLHGLGAGGEDADLLGDGGGGDLVVAGNHDGPDTGGDALTDGRLGLLPGRVHHGDEAQELEVVLILQADGGGGQHPLAEGQHPQALLGQLLVHPLDLRLLLRREASAAQHHVHGPLGQHGQAVRQLVDCAHQLPVGVKGQLRQTGILAPRLRLVEAVALAQAHQGGLCGPRTPCGQR